MGVTVRAVCDAAGCGAWTEAVRLELDEVSGKTARIDDVTAALLTFEGRAALTDGWVAGSRGLDRAVIYCAEHGELCPNCKGACFLPPNGAPCPTCNAVGVMAKVPVRVMATVNYERSGSDAPSG